MIVGPWLLSKLLGIAAAVGGTVGASVETGGTTAPLDGAGVFGAGAGALLAAVPEHDR